MSVLLIRTREKKKKLSYPNKKDKSKKRKIKDGSAIFFNQDPLDKCLIV